jgi:hypothetical protein
MHSKSLKNRNFFILKYNRLNETTYNVINPAGRIIQKKVVQTDNAIVQ